MEAKKNFAINIGRSVGSGGHHIGRQLATKLNWGFYDNELIKMAAIESGFSEDLFKSYDEKKSKMPSRLFEYFPGTTTQVNINNIPNVMSQEYLFKINSEVMIKLSEKGNGVFIGRCADYILRDVAECINVFCYAPKDFRLQFIMNGLNVDESQAEKIIIKEDRARPSYYSKFTNKKWGAAESYHLLVDTSQLGVDGTVELIEEYVKLRVK